MSKYSGLVSDALAASLLEQSLPSNIIRDHGDDLRSWIVLMDEWNQKTDLTAAKSAEQLVDLAVADAYRLSLGIAQGSVVVDIGSGAGAPGLPLAMLRPDLSVTLVEPLRKRVAFLRTVVGKLGLSTMVVPKRAEQFVDSGGRAQVAISRATLEPSSWLRLGEKIVEPAGRVAVLLARHDPPQSTDTSKLSDCVQYPWPLTGVQRRLCWYEHSAEAAGRTS